MLAAPCKISVSERRPEVKRKSAIPIDARALRCEARMAVVCNTALSPGARLLYVLLDDYARGDGECWPHQETLAERIGMSLRHVKRHLAELEGAGHIRRTRGRNITRYGMGWGEQTRTNPNKPEVPQMAPAQVPPAPREVPPVALAYKEFEESRQETCRCGGSGTIWYEDHRADGVRRKRVRCGCM